MARLNFSKGIYARCDSNGCEEFPLKIDKAGVFSILSTADRAGTFLKVVNDGSEFVEVSNIATAVLVQFGTCKKDE